MLMSIPEQIVNLLREDIRQNATSIADVRAEARDEYKYIRTRLDSIPAEVSDEIRKCKAEHSKLNIPPKIWLAIILAILSLLGIGGGAAQALFNDGPQKASVAPQK